MLEPIEVTARRIGVDADSLSPMERAVLEDEREPLQVTVTKGQQSPPSMFLGLAVVVALLFAASRF